MFIKKEQKRKNAIRITFEKDIPEFLRGTIKIDGTNIIALTAEGPQKYQTGMVFGYEKTTLTPTGYGAWGIANESRIQEKEDGIYTAPQVTQASVITDQLPSFMLEFLEDLTRNNDGSWSLKTNWGISTGFPEKAMFVKYGPGDANILNMETESFHEYILCDERGNDICKLDKVPLEKLKEFSI